MRVVSPTQVSVEQVQRPKRYQTMEEVLEELKAYGIVPMEQKALPRLSVPRSSWTPMMLTGRTRPPGEGRLSAADFVAGAGLLGTPLSTARSMAWSCTWA